MSIKLTDNAASELKTLMSKEVEGKKITEEAVLRLMVVGGGCSGFSYKMGFDESVTEQDKVEDIKGVKVAVDQKSYLYLNGTEVARASTLWAFVSVQAGRPIRIPDQLKRDFQVPPPAP